MTIWSLHIWRPWHIHTEEEGEQREDLEANAGEMLFCSITPTAAQVMHWTIPRSAIFIWVMMWLVLPESCNPAVLSHEPCPPWCPWQDSHQSVKVEACQGVITFSSNPDGWKDERMTRETPEREMMLLTVPILTWLCTLRRPPAWGAQATSCFFPMSKYPRKFKFWACSGDQELLIIYALTWDNCPL